MRTALSLSLGSLGCLMAFAGCTASVDDLSSVDEDLSLVACDRDDQCDRGEVCLITEGRDGRTAHCSTGDRCTDSRSCPTGSVCRGGDGLHCMVVERDLERPDACPRGTSPGFVLCAPGFENVTVSRDPFCATCEPTGSIAERCRAAGIDLARCRSLVGGGDEPTTIHDRCRAAGLTTDRCRALVSEDLDGAPAIERCRAAGLTVERCRAIVTGEDHDARVDRCRAAGISDERCRALLTDDPTRDGTDGRR